MSSLGSIVLEKATGQWQIVAAPHVAARIKRILGKVDKGSLGGKLALSDTLENARDLEWVLSRYKFDLTPAHYAYLVKRAAEHKDRDSLIASLLASQVPPQAFKIQGTARDYQAIGASLVLKTNSLLLADDVGLGKTLVAILMQTDPRTRPALVVTLAHLPIQWRDELATFAPNLRTHIIKSSTPYDLTDLKRKSTSLWLPESMPDVLITTYHKLSGWADTLGAKGVIRSVTFDEAQELRHSDSQRYVAARYIAQAADFRLGTTATPIYNYGLEFFNVFDVISPGALGTREEFIREWCTAESGGMDYDYSNGNGGRPKVKIYNTKAFGTYVRQAGLMLRRTRSEVGRELPPITTIPHYIEADLKELDKVSSSCAELARIILAQKETFRGQKLQASEEFSNKLRQATGIAKAPFVANFVRLIVESGEKVLLFGWHRAVYDIWHDRLKDLGLVFYTGKESPTQKQQAKADFIDPAGPSIMAMSLRAGAGVDGLQKACKIVVFGEIDWSNGIHEQNIGRVARDGQQSAVSAYFLLSDTGADPIMCDVLGIKREQLENVRDPDADIVEKLQLNPDHIKMLARNYLEQVGRR